MKFKSWLVWNWGKTSMNRHHNTSTGKCCSLLSSRQSLVLAFCLIRRLTKIGKWTLAVSCTAWGVVIEREVWVQPLAELQAHLPKAELYLLAGEIHPYSISEHAKKSIPHHQMYWLGWPCGVWSIPLSFFNGNSNQSLPGEAKNIVDWPATDKDIYFVILNCIYTIMSTNDMHKIPVGFQGHWSHISLCAMAWAHPVWDLGTGN